jgi:hypothetical protein
MRGFLIYILFFVLYSTDVVSQDKLFLRKDSVIHCRIVSISGADITYRDSVLSKIKFIKKYKVLIAEYSTGEVHVFSDLREDNFSDSTKAPESGREKGERLLREWKKKEAGYANYLIGFYPSDVLVGRLTLAYERLFANKTIGVNVPFSLTYNPNRTLRYLTTGSSAPSNTNNAQNSPSGVGFISGLDVNYYYDIEPETKYYFGPRLRYGTDVLLGNIEGVTFQIQNGIMLLSDANFTTNVGFGIGFFKLSSRYSGLSLADRKQAYPWMSITWRICFRA